MANTLQPFLSKLETYYLIAWISGWRTDDGAAHRRLRSCPTKDVLVLPWITPSGFCIGMIFTWNFDFRYLAYGRSETKASINPLTMKEDTVSPGCTLAITNKYSLLSSTYLTFDFSSTINTSFFKDVKPILFTLIKFFASSVFFRYFFSWV